jgi:radical SAM protein with 4Fe4S-binding SPASM domain
VSDQTASIESGQSQEKPKDFARFAEASSPDKVVPRYCVWEITLACDLGCKHCGSRAGNVRNEELSTEQCLDVVKQLKDGGFTEVTLIGGEAYLREDWDIIAAAITKSGMACTMTTGGRGMNEERVKRAEDAGLRHISFSIDGLEQTHDAQRGVPGSWRAAIDGAKRVAKTSMGVGMNTQINRLSLPELPALSQLLIDLGALGWQIQITVPMGRGADRPGMLLQPYDLLDVFPLLSWIKTQRLKPAGARLFPGNNIGYFGPFEEVLRYGGASGTHWSGCKAGKNCVGIEADGKIKGCPSLPSDHFTGGYTQTESIMDVLHNSKEVNHTRLRSKDDLWGYCKECYYADVCMGGCTWTSHCTMGKAGNNPYCIHRAMEYEAKGLHEHLIRTSPPPGIPFDHGVFETRLHPLPDVDGQAPPQILGISLERILELTWRDGSIWTDEERRAKLKRAPRLVQIG